MTRFQGKYPRRFVEVLWDLYQERGMTVPELAELLGSNARGVRGLFAKNGFSAGRWTEAELADLYQEYQAGAFLSVLAKRRNRKVSELLALFKERGWEERPRTTYVLPSRRLPDDLIGAMHADHLAGMGFADLGRKYDRDRQSIRGMFRYRGLRIIERKSNPRRQSGQFVAAEPLTPAEIDALIQSATRLVVPAELKLEWRKWDLARRGEFLTRLRARLQRPQDRPELPFSANVEPFDYASEKAWEIVNARNAGHDSRTAPLSIQLTSQGVIWEGELWFWSYLGRGYYKAGGWSPEHGRPSLHRIIYERQHGPLNRKMVVTHADGNPNNLDPANLVARTRNDICRENHSTGLTRKSREMTTLLLNRSQSHEIQSDLLGSLAGR